MCDRRPDDIKHATCKWLEITADSDARVGLGQQPGGLKPVKRGWRVMAGICERFQPPALVVSGREAMN